MAVKEFSHNIYPECFFPVEEPAAGSERAKSPPLTFGFCKKCNETHSLSGDFAKPYCKELMERFTVEKNIDLHASPDKKNPIFSTDYLFGQARGQMFGVLICRHKDGTLGILKAFSCQYNGHWLIQGWVPPLFETQAFNSICLPVDKEIKLLGKKIADSKKDSIKQKGYIKKRKLLSQDLMKEIHCLYRISNFNGETKSIYDIFPSDQGIPSGAGDCCAPKLLNYAAVNELYPISLAEFYWGMENRSKTREHGEFYHACKEKCQPILGYMLCGL